MSTQQFYPASFGMSKQQAINLLYSYLMDEQVWAPRLKELPVEELVSILDDEVMQTFIDAYYKPVYDYIGDCMPETQGRIMNGAVKKLAVVLLAKLPQPV